MGRTRKVTETTSKDRVQRPAMSPEAREKQMIALATGLAEQKLIDGTASSAIITHYLKLGTVKEQKEMALLELQKELMETKIDSAKAEIKSSKAAEEALEAFKIYSGYNGSRIIKDEYEEYSDDEIL